ncbi:TolC family protein [Stratiformator vulcanicus]|uniref:Outer membrane efflux protein n=1 Tax=Stratiformator vulcanicus TaxID=2527980 RepID=A0A517QXK1_9PLAN|nr:TolC family protein [Stratiformator vulcanicus]QDT36379.1 Outer membrane efflux protein [Stratiformator vulcanicus]
MICIPKNDRRNDRPGISLARGVLMLLAIGTMAGLTSGCSSYDWWRLKNDNAYGNTHPQEPIVKVAYAPDVRVAPTPDPNPITTPRPRTIARDPDGPIEYWDMTLDEAVQYALANAKVMRRLGGRVLSAPDTVQTRYETAIQYTDPRSGPEAALAAFDAEFATRAFFENNDRFTNNLFFGGGTTIFQQDLNIYQTELRKTAATGTQFFLRNNTEYDNNNAPANVFPSFWQTNIETEIRQPLLQGSGVLFNRIAGPDGSAGIYSGVIIARTDNDITQAEFETALRAFMSDVINSYWELHFGYRELEALKKARDRAQETWESFDALLQEDRVDSDREALAREQYFRFQQDVEVALAGRPGTATQTGSGEGGGTFRGSGGVQSAERRLRLLIGAPINDHRMIRPVESNGERPEIIFDWEAITGEALGRRPEIRRQKLTIKRREMELAAAKNFLSPRLDAVGLYRWRGFGDDLLDYNAGATAAGGTADLDNAVDSLVHGDFQEWQLGVEFSMPIGFRQGHAAVQNAELRIARERAVLREQEREIVYNLSDAIADKDRAYQTAQTSLNRYKAAYNLLRSLEEQRELGRDIDLDRLLDAQRRLADAESEFFRSMTSYEIALKNVHFEKGSLFDEFGVLLSGHEEPTAASPTHARTVPDQMLPPAPESAPEPSAEPMPTFGDAETRSSGIDRELDDEEIAPAYGP